METYNGPVVPGCGNELCEQSKIRLTAQRPTHENLVTKAGPAGLRPWPVYLYCHVCQMVSSYELVIPGLFKRLAGAKLTFELKGFDGIENVPAHSQEGLRLEIKASNRRRAL